MQINRVLLAHRDSVVEELATRAVSRLGVTVDVAADTADALAHIARESYTVICLHRDDALLAAIAETHAGTRPVVIVTAENGEGLDPAIVSLFVPEPYDAHTLVGVILACVTPGNVPLDSTLPGDLLHDL